MSWLHRSAPVPPLSEQRRAEIIAEYNARKVALQASAQTTMSLPRLIGGLAFLVPFLIGAMIAFSYSAASNINAHPRESTQMWVEFGVGFAVGAGWLAMYLWRNTLGLLPNSMGLHRHPSDRLLRAIAMQGVRAKTQSLSSRQITVASVGASISLIGMMSIKTLLHHIYIGAPLLGLMGGLILIATVVLTYVGMGSIKYRLATKTQHRGSPPVNNVRA